MRCGNDFSAAVGGRVSARFYVLRMPQLRLNLIADRRLSQCLGGRWRCGAMEWRRWQPSCFLLSSGAHKAAQDHDKAHPRLALWLYACRPDWPQTGICWFNVRTIDQSIMGISP